jgi:hypothetical protein
MAAQGWGHSERTVISNWAAWLSSHTKRWSRDFKILYRTLGHAYNYVISTH